MTPSLRDFPDKVWTDLETLEGPVLAWQATMRVQMSADQAAQACQQLCDRLQEWQRVSQRYGVPQWQRLAPTWAAFCQTYVRPGVPEMLQALGTLLPRTQEEQGT